MGPRVTAPGAGRAVCIAALVITGSISKAANVLPTAPLPLDPWPRRAQAECSDPPGLGERTAAHREVFLPPASSAEHSAWLAAITQWRQECRRQIGYTGGVYNERCVR